MNKVEEVLAASSKRWWTGKEGFDYEVSSTEQESFSQRLQAVLTELRSNETAHSSPADSPADRFLTSINIQ